MGMKNLFVFSSLNRNFALSLQSKVGRMLPLVIGRQRMISAIGLPMSGIASSHPCRRRLYPLIKNKCS